MTAVGGDGGRPRARARVPRQAYLVLAAAVVMQVCLGAPYAWSVFARVLHDTEGLTQSTAQFPYTVFYIVFPATTVAAGRLLERLGPRRMALLGGLTFGAGWTVAGVGHAHFVFTVLGMGLLGGMGVGFAYLVPISAGMRWFPGRKGLVTGVAVAGFGGGAALVSQAAAYLMGRQGLTPFQAMGVLGLSFLVLVLPAAGFICYPPSGAGRIAARPVPTRFLRDRDFWMLYVAMFAGLAAGFTVNANMAQLAPALGQSAGVTAVGLFAVANAAGRICWGLIFDRVSSVTAIRANLVSQAVVLLVHPWLLTTPVGLGVMAAVAGFNYGGVLVLYASSAGRRWGAEHVGRVYGWLFSSNMVAALAPLLAAWASEATNSFRAALLALAVLLLGVAGGVRLRA